MSKPLRSSAVFWLKVAFLAPAFILGIPLQYLALHAPVSLARHLPVWFHRYACLVLGIRCQIIGQPAAHRPLLIVANHISWLDILVLGSVMPLSFVAKAEVARWPVFGMLARLQRTVFVDRQKRAKTATAAGDIANRLKQGDAMVLFAEGTTSDGTRVLPFRSALLGAAQGAMGEGSALVQPLCLRYTRLGGMPVGLSDRPFIGWYGDMELLPHLKAIFTGPALDVSVVFCPPIDMDGTLDRKQVSEAARQHIRRAARGLTPILPCEVPTIPDPPFDIASKSA